MPLSCFLSFTVPFSTPHILAAYYTCMPPILAAPCSSLAYPISTSQTPLQRNMHAHISPALLSSLTYIPPNRYTGTSHPHPNRYTGTSVTPIPKHVHWHVSHTHTQTRTLARQSHPYPNTYTGTSHLHQNRNTGTSHPHPFSTSHTHLQRNMHAPNLSCPALLFDFGRGLSNLGMHESAVGQLPSYVLTHVRGAQCNFLRGHSVQRV